MSETHHQTNVFGTTQSHARVGRPDEWHLDLPKAFGHEAFQFVSRQVEILVLSMGLLSSSGLEAIRSIGDAMDGDGVEQLLVKSPTKRGVALALDVNHWLKGLQRLDRAFEADRSRLDAVCGRGLSHDCANEVVSEDVRPDLLSHKLGRLASQHVHLQRLLQ